MSEDALKKVLFEAYAGSFHNFLPSGDIVHEKLRELLRRSGSGVETTAIKLLLYVGHLQRAHGFAVQLVNDGLRRARGGDQTIPLGRQDGRIAGFGKRRHVLKPGRPLIAAEGERLEFSRVHVINGRSGPVEHQLQAAAQQVAKGSPGALVGHVDEVRPGYRLEQLRRHMADGPHPR